MSGRRTKALRRELLKDLGRAPLETKWHNSIRLEHGEGEKTVTPNSGLRRFLPLRSIATRIKKAVGWFSTNKQAAHSEVVIGNEFRRYKREWKRRAA